jgi:pimeloyl-ACP methyl ester carboxylesterase
VAETSYAKCGDLSLAYQVFGDGPVELVFVGPIVGHTELFWTLPEFKAFFDQLAMFCRVVMFDKAGNGLSDPIPKVRLLEERAAEIAAVMDAVGFAKPALFGTSEGGPPRANEARATADRLAEEARIAADRYAEARAINKLTPEAVALFTNPN